MLIPQPILKVAARIAQGGPAGIVCAAAIHAVRTAPKFRSE
ncbi:MAG: hypothetical protein RLZZ15_2782 [Verrucomicrobiota bacterium]|jgi:hypothetical protein